MISGEQIRAYADEAGIKAKKAKKVPKLFKTEEDRSVDFCKTIPFLGSYVPEGWYIEDGLFVDSSGFGAPGEAALTAAQFLQKLEVGKGYAVIESGEFQVYVGVFGKN
jgi:hypothetical protein